jgi:alpha-amylase
MAKLCLYFQLHQPYRLRPFSIFELNRDVNYFSIEEDAESENAAIFRKVAQKSYLPMLSLLLELVRKQTGFCVALSCSGVFLEQAQAYEPRVISLLKKLIASGNVELLAETYYHSLASLYSPEEFGQQVAMHAQLVQELFDYTPTIFRNTELIYSNDIALLVQKLGFAGMLTEAVGRYLGDRNRTQVFRSYTEPTLPLLLKHAQLSDDIAFRFSNKNWEEHPLTSEKYVHWLDSYGQDEYINLFMDFETFGEHQWSDTGIFDFFKHMVSKSLKRGHSFVSPSQVLSPFSAAPKLAMSLPVYDVPEPISWADIDRDLTAWRGNSLQDDVLRLVYSLEEKVLQSEDHHLIDDWRRLQTSDHFYYMCVKWSADGDVHKYFSPYDSPFEAYNRFTAVLTDFQDRLQERDYA